MRQGDPLLPLLFYIVEEALSKGLSALVDSHDLGPMTGPKQFQMPSHVMYVDNVISFFFRGTIKNIKNLFNLFKL